MGNVFLKNLQDIHAWSPSIDDSTNLAWDKGGQMDQTLFFSIQEREQGPARGSCLSHAASHPEQNPKWVNINIGKPMFWERGTCNWMLYLDCHSGSHDMHYLAHLHYNHAYFHMPWLLVSLSNLQPANNTFNMYPPMNPVSWNVAGWRITSTWNCIASNIIYRNQESISRHWSLRKVKHTEIPLLCPALQHCPIEMYLRNASWYTLCKCYNSNIQFSFIPFVTLCMSLHDAFCTPYSPPTRHW